LTTPPLFDLSKATGVFNSIQPKAGRASSPNEIANQIGRKTDLLIPDALATPSEFSGKIKDLMDFRELDEYKTVGSDNIKQTVTLFPTSNPNARQAPINPQAIGMNLATGDLPLTAGNIVINEDEEMPIPAPFSLYYPTVAWPFMTDEGKRYTVVDLGNEPISFPGQDFIGWLMGRKLDRVAALPGFRGWGDPLLGVGAVAPVAIAAIPVFILAPYWGPSLIRTGVKLGTTIMASSLEFVAAVGSAAKDLTKTIVKS